MWNLKQCGYCLARMTHVRIKEFVKQNGFVEETYEERCTNCGNLVFGYSKQLNKKHEVDKRWFSD